MHRGASVLDIGRCWPPRGNAESVASQGWRAEGEYRAAAVATSSERDRTRFPTSDSDSPCVICPFGGKYAPLAPHCSGSLDRPVLGHLCTEWPQNASIRTARARARSRRHGRWAAEHGGYIWGTAATQHHASSHAAARAPARRKWHHHVVRRAGVVRWTGRTGRSCRCVQHGHCHAPP